MKEGMTIREYLERFDKDKVDHLLVSAQKGSDKASGIHLPSYFYESYKTVKSK